MDVSPSAMVDRVVQMRQAEVQQEVQVRVLKEAMDTQKSTVAALISGVTGDMPLATSGEVGTQINTRA
jgi:uncharacterized protein (UPF0305 family)